MFVFIDILFNSIIDLDYWIHTNVLKSVLAFFYTLFFHYTPFRALPPTSAVGGNFFYSFFFWLLKNGNKSYTSLTVNICPRTWCMQRLWDLSQISWHHWRWHIRLLKGQEFVLVHDLLGLFYSDTLCVWQT